MVPRTEIVGIDLDDNISNLKRIFNKTGHSKVIVYRENVDQVIGYVHMIDLFENPENIKTILRPIIIIAESMPANKLLKEFTASNRSLGLVVDEYGGTAGIVTIEDVLEEIFGEIEDEFDKEDLKEVVVNDREYIFSARHEIDYLNEKYNLDLPMGDYETLGGYILEINESIPKENDIIETDEFKFTILTAQENRIENVGLIIKEILE
jgi:putative hemolysin